MVATRKVPAFAVFTCRITRRIVPTSTRVKLQLTIASRRCMYPFLQIALRGESLRTEHNTSYGAAHGLLPGKG